MINKEEIIKILSKLTLCDLINILYKNDQINDKKNKNILNAQELLIEYPIFSKYTLDKAIREQGLPFFKQGHYRYFEKSKIDKWINDKTTTLNNKGKDKYKL